MGVKFTFLKTRLCASLIVSILLLFISQNVYSQCYSPEPYSPSNGSTISALTPTICWQGGSGYYTGTMSIASDPNFSNIIYSHTFSPSENCIVVPTGYLQNNQHYWWGVGVLCVHGSASSSHYSFTISLTGIEKIGDEIPTSYSLSQNYPNPFNPTTKIKFDIPEYAPPLAKGGQGGLVSLKIYDILGREVAALVNEELKPGSYEYEWDASNFAGGVYFYQLIVSDPETSSGFTFKQTKRMVLMK